MEDNLKNIELIEAFYENRLSPEERHDFQVRLLVDKELEEEFEFYKKIVYGFDDIKADNIRRKLKQIDAEIDLKDKTRSKQRKGHSFWVVSSLLVISVLIIYLRYNSSTDYSSDMLPYEPGLPVLMGTHSQVYFDNGMSSFKAGDYTTAERLFSKFAALHQSDTSLFYLGNAQLRNGQYALAIESFKKVKLFDNSHYREKADYYLALAFLANRNKKEAGEVLRLISLDTNHLFYKEASALIVKLH